MLDQLFNLVKQLGKDTVIENPEIPNEQNEGILAEATKTIGSGFQNLMAGGGFENILDLFKGGGNTSNSSSGGIGGLLKNPIVAMMIGYFTKKLVSKFSIAPASAANISNNLIPSVLNGLINKTTSNDPENDAFDFNDLIGSLTGGNVPTKESSSNGFDFQGLLNQFTGGGNGGGGFNIGDINSTVTQGAQRNQAQDSGGSGGGLMDLIKGFMK